MVWKCPPTSRAMIVRVSEINIAGLKKNILQKSINSYSRSAGADIIGLSPF
jgi:hypothetical protein